MEYLPMTAEIAATLGLTGMVFYLFISEKFSTDINAIIVLVVLGLLSELPFLTPLIKPEQLFAGFSSNAVIAIIALMIMAAGIERSGAMNLLTRQIMRVSGDSATKLMVCLCLSAGLMSSVIQNIGVVALFIPVASYLQFHAGIPMSRTLMPIGFCIILGGNLTLLGNGSLIILNELLATMSLSMNSSFAASSATAIPVGMFALAPVGLALLAFGTVFFSSPLGRELFRQAEGSGYRQSGSTLLSHFQLEIGIFRIAEDSTLIGQSVRAFEDKHNTLVVALANGKDAKLAPLRDSLLNADSRIVVLADKDGLQQLNASQGVRPVSGSNRISELFQQQGAGYSEVVVSSKSPLVGKSIHEVYFRRQYGLTPIVIQRREQKISGAELNYVELKPGDLLVLHGGRKAVDRLKEGGELVMVTSECPDLNFDGSQALKAILWFTLSLFLLLVLQLPVGLCLWLGVLGMFVSGVIAPYQAYQAVSWRTVVMLAGLIPLGMAVEQTGTAAWLSHWALKGLPAYPWILQLAVATITSLLTLVMSNVGTTILLLPVAMNLAVQMHQDPLLFALIVAVSSSNSFIIPTHQANALIFSTGQYRVRKFVQVGGIMTVAYLGIELIILNMIF
jgi:di/tricarboxylate transporter